jgi:hypothetical protein
MVKHHRSTADNDHEPSRVFHKSAGHADVSRKATRIQQALVWVHKAKAGSTQWVDNCTEEQFNYYHLAKRTKWLGYLAKYGLLLCSIFDLPSWCRGTPAECSNYVKQLYSPFFPILPVRAGAGISAIFWCILLGRMYARKLAMGSAHRLTQWRIFTAAVLLIGGLSAIVSLLLPMVYNVSILMRPFAFMGCTKPLRKGFTNIMIAVPGFFDVLVSLGIAVFAGVWSGMVIFARTPEGAANFWAWRQGFAQMWILFTTNNTQSMLLPAYDLDRAYFFVFLAYVVVTVYFLGNMLLARVYNTYKGVLKQEYVLYRENQNVAISRAFVILSDGVIDERTFRDFFAAYCDPLLGHVTVGDPADVEHNMQQASKILQMEHDIGMDEGCSVSCEQFKRIMCALFDSEIYIAKRRQQQEFMFGFLKDLNHFQIHGYRVAHWLHITWDGMMDVVIAMGTLCAFYESWVFAHIYNTQGIFIVLTNQPEYWVLFFISLIYAFGITTKISSLGMERFWHRKPIQHRFDFVNVYGLIILETIYMCGWPTVGILRTILLFHMARGMRLMMYVKPLQQFLVLITRLVPVYQRMTMILFTVFWIFCEVGQLWFGGLIYTSNPTLAGTGFAESGYYELNFNCFFDAMVTLFILMCVNSWNTISDGYMQATGSFLSQAYFVMFTIVVNLIIVNIIIALIIESTGAFAEEVAAQQTKTEHDEGCGGGMSREAAMSKIFGDERSEESSESSSGSSEDDKDSAIEQAIASASTSRMVVARGHSRHGTACFESAGSSALRPVEMTKEEKKRFQRLQGRTSKQGRRKSIA